MTEVFATLAAAGDYAFSLQAAAAAASERLVELDRHDLVLIAALLAGLVAVELRPHGNDDLETWRAAYALHLAMQEPQ